MTSSITAATPLELRSQVTCPHCWHKFPPEEICWIAAHPDLVDDHIAGPDAQLRFVPTVFDVTGNAIDAKGGVCRDLACPACHLGVCRSLLEMKPLFISILGAPGSGKSFFLTSMIQELETTLQARFRISFGNADPVSNQKLSEYKEKLFRNEADDSWVTLEKTEQQGDLYESVAISGRPVWYPRPFIFSLQPVTGHRAFEHRHRISRALCLYDNAGEHFLPGGVTANTPVTHHLGLSSALLFLFDPTQEPNFRRACRGRSGDPQMAKHGWNHRQDLVLADAARRIRDQTGLSEKQTDPRPLVVLVTKYDAWSGLTKEQRLSSSLVIRKAEDGQQRLDVSKLQDVSRQVRHLLLKHASEIVATAEGFSNDVTYIPVSSIGCSPTLVGGSDGKDHLLIRASDIRPMWAEVPMLFVLHKAVKGLVPAIQNVQDVNRSEVAASAPEE